MWVSRIPGLGVFPGRNITPDKETGIGNWSTEQIAASLTTGKRPDGRMLAPIMPYHSFSYLTKEDVAAIVAFLQSIPPVKNQVAGPFDPSQKYRSSRSEAQIAAALTTGKRPDGRVLAPIMPYHAFSYLTKEDVAAIVAFLQSIPLVKNQVAGPFDPGQKVSIFTFRILPPGETAAAAPK